MLRRSWNLETKQIHLFFTPLTGITQRKTRSGRAYGCWDAAGVAQDFNLLAQLQEAVAHDDRRNELLETTLNSLEYELERLSDDEFDCPPPHQPLTSEDLVLDTSPAPFVKRASSSTPCTPSVSKIVIPSNLTGKARKNARKKAQSHHNCQKDRAAANAAVFSHHTMRPNIAKKYIVPDNATNTAVNIVNSKVTHTAYVGLDNSIRDGRTFTLEELVGPESEFRFQLLKYKKGVSVPIVSSDAEKYIIAVFADSPNDTEWPALVAAAAKYLEDARQRCDLDEKDIQHRRGSFSVLRTGVSHGGGQKMPGNLTNRSVNATIAKELNLQPPFRRLAGFATGAMASWAPRMHDYYQDRLGKLHAKYSLQRNFNSSVFEATSYNLGPRTVSYRHLDFANLPFGWCAVTALGDFDYTRGGHIVLWDAMLVIEFPPGTTILLPSAIIGHSNTSIATHERRYLFTQYSAGGLFWWVENGFQRSANLLAKLKRDPDALARHRGEEQGWWEFGLSLLSHLDEIQNSSST